MNPVLTRIDKEEYVLCMTCGKHNPRCDGCGESFQDNDQVVCDQLFRHRHPVCDWSRDDE